MKAVIPNGRQNRGGKGCWSVIGRVLSASPIIDGER